MRTLLFSLVVLSLALVLFGCEGNSRHTVVTDEDGSMLGLVVTPEPQSLSIDRSDDFLLDWPAGYAPPSEFTITLRKVDTDGTTEAILTDLGTISTGHYRLEPTSTLPAGTFLLLTIASDRERVRAMYLTDDDAFGMTREAKEGEGKAEHTIRTR
jgi:hypothetical protein